MRCAQLEIAVGTDDDGALSGALSKLDDLDGKAEWREAPSDQYNYKGTVAITRQLHDARLGNQRLKVEFAKSRGKNAAPGASGSTSAAPVASVAPDAGQTTSKPKPVRVKHRAVLEGLPPSFTWKELKDEMRRIGRILYADIDEHGDGIVDFESADDLDYAVRVINGSMLDGAVIRVRRAGDGSSSGGPSEERREPDRRRDDDDRRRPRDEREAVLSRRPGP